MLLVRSRSVAVCVGEFNLGVGLVSSKRCRCSGMFFSVARGPTAPPRIKKNARPELSFSLSVPLSTF